jgi:hypothetical protein
MTKMKSRCQGEVQDSQLLLLGWESTSFQGQALFVCSECIKSVLSWECHNPQSQAGVIAHLTLGKPGISDMDLRPYSLKVKSLEL